MRPTFLPASVRAGITTSNLGHLANVKVLGSLDFWKIPLQAATSCGFAKMTTLDGTVAN